MESAPITKSGENECLLTSGELESEARELPVGRAKRTHTVPRTPARCSPRRALVDGSLVASRTIQTAIAVLLISLGILIARIIVDPGTAFRITIVSRWISAPEETVRPTACQEFKLRLY